MSSSLPRVFAALMFCAAGTVANSAVIWNGAANPNANWSVGNNWMGAAAPVAGAAQSLIFDGAVNLSPTNDIGNPFQLNNISFPATAGAFNVGGQPIQFAGTSPSITQSAAIAEAISANIALGAGLTLNGNGAGVATLSGVVSGANPLIVSGGASWVLGGTAANTYSGVTTVVAGQLTLSKNANVVAVPGDVVIGTAASAGVPTLVTSANGQLPATSNITMAAGAAFSSAFNVQGTTQTIATLKGNGGVTIGANGSLSTGGAGAAAPFAGTFSGTGTLVKSGANVLAVTGLSPNFAGTLNVSQGTLKLNGDLGARATRKVPAFTVAANALLTGKGNIWQTKGTKNTIKGKVQPGDDPGILTIGGDIEMQAGSNFTCEIDGTVPGQGPGFCSQLVIGGDVLLDPGSTLALQFDSAPVPGASYVLLDNQGGDPILGNFDGLPEGQLFTADGTLFSITYQGNDPFDSLSAATHDSVVITAVPEPMSLALLLAGAALSLTRRRRPR